MSIDRELLKRAAANTGKKKTGSSSASSSYWLNYKAPTKSDLAKQKYIQTLGFTPKDVPEFRKKGSTGNIALRALDLLDRAGSGARYSLLNKYNQDIGNRKSGNRGETIKDSLVDASPLALLKYSDDFWKGATGDINVTGRSLFSRVVDDPYVRKDMGANTKRFVDSKYTRAGVGFGVDVLADPLNIVPIGAPLKVAGRTLRGGSKAIGLTDNIIAPLAKRAKVATPVQKVIKELGGGRSAGWKAATSGVDIQRAMASEIGALSKKLMEDSLKPREITKLRASIKGLVASLVGENEAKQVLKNFDTKLDESLRAAESLKRQGKTLDQKKLYEYLIGVQGRTGIQRNLSTALREGSNKPVEFGKLPKKLQKQINAVLEAGGQKTIQNGATKVYPAVIRKSRNKRIIEGGLSPETLSDIAFSVVHGRPKVLPGRYPNTVKLLKPKNTKGKINTGIIGEYKGEASLKSFYPQSMKTKSVLEGGTKSPSSGLIGNAPQSPVSAAQKQSVGSIPTGANYVNKPSSLRSSVNTPRQQIDAYEKSIAPALDNVKSARALQAADYIYKQIAGVGRSLQDEVISPLLTKTGAISQEVLEKNKGEYIRKFYKNPEDLRSAFKQVGSKAGVRGFGAELGATKMAKNNPLRVIEYLTKNGGDEFKGIIKEYRSELAKYGTKDVAAMNEAAELIEPKLKELLGKDYKAFALKGREQAGLITEGSLALSNSVEQGLDLAVTQNFLNNAKQFAVEGITEDQALKQGLKRIPDTAKYGSMAGKFVPDVVHDDIVGILDMGGGQWRKFINAWKQIKLFAPFNFATPSRNFTSDVIANSMVDGGPSILTQFTKLIPKAIKEMHEGGDLYRQLTERGVFASTYANQEARKTLMKAIGHEGTQGVGDLALRGANALTTGKGRYGTEIYGAISDMGKMVQVMHQLNKGKSLDEAIEVATKATFDYSKLPVSLRKYKDNFMPFLTYKYFAIQLLWDTLVNRTGKISKLTHTRRAIEGLTADEANDRDLPEYMRTNRPFYIRTPFKDSKDNPRYLDLSYIYPMGDVGETSGLDMVLGNPVFRSAVELGFNKNTFTGQPIAEEGMLPSDKAKARAKYLLQQFSPNSPLMPGTSGFRKLAQTIKGEETPMKVKSQARYVLPEVFAGVKLKEVNPGLQRQYNQYDKQDKEGDIKTQINKIKKNKKLTSKEKKEKIKKLNEQLSNLRKL